jgi:hypothetical protein
MPLQRLVGAHSPPLLGAFLFCARCALRVRFFEM